MQVTDQFVFDVRAAWGNPEKVARAGIAETFRQPDYFGLDHDDQVNNAIQIGILAGLMVDQAPDDFVARFSALVE